MQFQDKVERGLSHCSGVREDPVVGLERLIELKAYDFASPQLRAELDRFARLSAEALHMPVGMVNVVMDTAQYLAGRYGDRRWILHADGISTDRSFCAEVVRSGTAYVVEDATADSIQSVNPLVTEDGVRSYAGVPLVSPSGHTLGTCCVLGTEPRHFTPADVKALQDIARRVVEVMSQYRQKYRHRHRSAAARSGGADLTPVTSARPMRSERLSPG